MAEQSNSIQLNLFGFVCPILLIAFILLKVTGLIGLSWFWVFSPLWIPILIFLAIISISLLVFFILFIFAIIIGIIQGLSK